MSQTSPRCSKCKSTYCICFLPVAKMAGVHAAIQQLKMLADPKRDNMLLDTLKKLCRECL